jgi:ABC-type oligopeptide transport system substrate-binding subunit
LFGEGGEQVLPYLARLLGVRLEGELDERVRILDGETLKRQTLVSITQYFEKLAYSQPTVAVFEDLHWADPSSLEALELLLSITDRTPLMLLLLSRLEREQASWQIKLKAETDFAHRYTEIQLKPLSASQQNQLVNNLLRIVDLPESVRELIQEHAEGNPFYLEEIVRSLIEQGAIIRVGNQWQATREILDVDIPNTLQGVLLARLDRLQEDVRRTLQLASVIGRSFLYSILEVISEAEQQLDQHLTQLQRVDLVREKARIPELEYMFKHSLTQEAAYSSLLLSRRSEFHRKVGEALEKLFPDRLEEFYGLLAHHFEAAGENQKAIEYLTRAGDKSRSMGELNEAIDYYQRTIPLLTTVGDTSRLAQSWLKLGLVYSTIFQFEDSHHANEQAFALQKQFTATQRPPVTLKPHVLRMIKTGSHFSLDPGEVAWEMDFMIASNLFAGLVQVDVELNVVPEVARSWQVLDDGRRYLFHLRDDVRWTDGSPVTAQDFEYAWKRNLQSRFAIENATAQFLFDVAGAQDYCEGRNMDPDSIGVRALDAYSLEVWLAEPVAYFLYILSMPITFPLPQKTIERFGDDWWQAGKMVCNGPYRLVEFNLTQGSVVERNPYYHGEFKGNVQRVELTFSQDSSQLLNMYQENSIDLALIEAYEIRASMPANEMQFFPHPRTNFIILATALPPLNDARVRKALAMALDYNQISSKFDILNPSGGLIPPGIPGHSPDGGLRYDLQAARQLLTEAGYPDGKGLPAITGVTRINMEQISAEISRQWHDNLGVEAYIEALRPHDLMALRVDQLPFHLALIGWIFDYPDPDNFLGHPNAFLDIAEIWGWHDEAYYQLVKEAGRTANQRKRMEMYRRADRMLVQDQVIIFPISYGDQTCTLVKPWVKYLQITPAGRILFKDILIEEH